MAAAMPVSSNHTIYSWYEDVSKLDVRFRDNKTCFNWGSRCVKLSGRISAFRRGYHRRGNLKQCYIIYHIQFIYIIYYKYYIYMNSEC